jgi:hypothetical protein
MPALKPVVGVARCVFTGLLNGRPVANIVHIKGQTGSPWSQADITALALAIRTSWQTRFCPQMNTGYTFTGVTATDLTTDTGYVGTGTSSTVGSKAAAGTTDAIACCISWKTAAHFRGGHCRTYLCGPSISEYSNTSTWTGTYMTAITTAASGFLTDINASVPAISPAMVLVRRVKDKAVLDVPLAYVVTNGVVDSRIDTMRRRLGKDR